MARAIWRGSISFGLVTVPVRLYTAARSADVRFREVDRRTRRPVRHQRVVDVEWARAPDPPPSLPPTAAPPPTYPSPAWRGEEVADVMRGFEVAPDTFVEVSDEELRELAPERSRTIDVEQFVSRKELDPIYFETPYHVVPDRDHVRPFALLLRAMQETNRAAVCWLVLRTRRHLAALEPRGKLMLLWTLRFADEIVPAKALEPPPEELGDKEVDMAELLVNTLSGPFEPERYRDEYRERLQALIAGKAEGVEREEPEPVPAPAGVEELMAALQASIDEARARRERKRQAG